MMSQGAALVPRPSPHCALVTGKIVFWPPPQAKVCAGPVVTVGSQQSELGAKLTPLRPIVPPPVVGHGLCPSPAIVVVHWNIAAVGTAARLVVPLFSRPNSPSQVRSGNDV